MMSYDVMDSTGRGEGEGEDRVGGFFFSPM